jgi:hypothetical protein
MNSLRGKHKLHMAENKVPGRVSGPQKKDEIKSGI